VRLRGEGRDDHRPPQIRPGIGVLGAPRPAESANRLKAGPPDPESIQGAGAEVCSLFGEPGPGFFPGGGSTTRASRLPGSTRRPSLRNQTTVGWRLRGHARRGPRSGPSLAARSKRGFTARPLAENQHRIRHRRDHKLSGLRPGVSRVARLQPRRPIAGVDRARQSRGVPRFGHGNLRRGLVEPRLLAGQVFMKSGGVP